MPDNQTQPCLQESEDWPAFSQDIERQLSKLEEISWFEREVTRRQAFVVTNGRKMSGDEVTEAACLAGLAAFTNTFSRRSVKFACNLGRC